ncbi:hypothetical protein [Neobacillus niacini]|uniref:hypothetical protein n=1 Tax=Neobacillus niacini TaxID=86668 RepID=UPI00203ABFFB|nr:hypothetical protein [Neobacillus niacini]MCM3690879.1 hypothetical protein [Neobacillus niacini]
MAIIGILFMCIVGCSNAIENEEQSIKVQKNLGNENNYEDFKEINQNERVKQVKEIVKDIDWENAKVSMVRPPDYRFGFQYKNPNIEAKAVLYELWISPNKDRVELVIDAESKYTQLDKETSAVLYELITEEKLSDLK